MCAKPISAVKFYTPSAYTLQGVFFMCRQSVFWSCVEIAFGFGMLLGIWIGGGFLAHCVGFGLMGMGICGLMKK
jgi:hypothetical protein